MKVSKKTQYQEQTDMKKLEKYITPGPGLYDF
jgi:hypothetical protein